MVKPIRLVRGNVRQPAKRVDDVVALAEQVLGTRWLPVDQCTPPQGMEFFGLFITGKDDYKIDHCVFDGSGNEGLEKMTHWFPAPPLPKRASSYPPNDQDLGEKLRKSFALWARKN